MRSSLAVVAALATAGAVAVTSPGSATADLVTPPLPLPSVSVPLPTESAPVPAPTLPGTETVTGVTGPAPVPSLGGGSGGGTTSGSTAGSSSDSPATASGEVAPSGASAAAPTQTLTAKQRLRRAKDATPMVAGTAAVKDLLDEENSPQLLAASRQFLAADQGIAEIARQKRLMADLKTQAKETAQVYRAYGYELITARATQQDMHARADRTGTRQASDAATRADLRVGDVVVAQQNARADFERIAARYAEAQRRLADANQRLTAYAAARSTALEAVQSAKGGDIALNQARVAESGQLGSQIRALSAALARNGDTVRGTGELAAPVAGAVTSPFGMRKHPILGYVKLHTGTDFAGGSTILAADTGRVIMTVTSTAYGNFTVIDHGVIDGHRLTTAYAHQAQFLVREGDAVTKGQPIGIVGSTGYSTGPHLHFEVREDGAVVDPMTWLAR